jgi:ABC-type amino acid transport substrate-binding protein
MGRKLLISAIALALCICISLPAMAGPAMDRINESKVIRVGTDPHFPPLCMETVDGGIMGLEVDMMNALAQQLDMKIRWVIMPFSELLDAVVSGKVDMAVCGISVTGARNLKVVFAGPYMTSGQSMLINQKNAKRFTSTEAMNQPDVKITAAKGTTAERTVPQLMPKAQILWTDNQQEALELLKKDQADVVVADHPFCVMAQFFLKPQGIVSMGKPFTFEPYSIAIKPGDPHLHNLLKNFLFAMTGAGAFKALEIKWFKQAGWINRLRKTESSVYLRRLGDPSDA